MSEPAHAAPEDAIPEAIPEVTATFEPDFADASESEALGETEADQPADPVEPPAEVDQPVDDQPVGQEALQEEPEATVGQHELADASPAGSPDSLVPEGVTVQDR